MQPVESGRLMALIGSSRSGKTKKTMSELARFDRVLIWDVKGEYDGDYRVRTRDQLVKAVRKLQGRPGRIVYTSDQLSDFSYFCRVAQVWVKGHYLAGKNCALVFEETADVTSPGKAPVEYGIILRRYLAFGVSIFAITQRPAESDKTAVGNASQVHICRLQLDRDKRGASLDTNVPINEISALKADQVKHVYDYISVDTGRGFWRKGRLTFRNNKPVFTDEKAEKPL